MLCTIARYWIPVFDQAKATRITLRQRQISRDAFVTQSPTWQLLERDTQQQLKHLFDNPDLNAHQFIELMHSRTMQQFCECFPAGQARRPLPEWQSALPTILTKWDHRRAVHKPRICTCQNIFRAWFHASRFQALKRYHRLQARSIRTARFREVVQQAAEAAAQHNTHRLFHIINRFAPKQPKRQIQLRNHQGHMATPVESAALLNRYVADSWQGPCENGLTFDHAPGVPFTIDQLEQALAMIPATKATAKTCVPGILWKQHASFLAPLLHAKLSEWWSTTPPCIPDAWRHGWLFMIPKPSKAPVTPSNLRPLVLQDPVGKAVIGLLIHLAMQQANHQIVTYPLWGYVAHRSTLDAIRRVSLHCALVRQFMATQRSTPHTRAVQQPRLGFYGGIQICLDLQRAFDNVDRSRLFRKLSHLSITDSITQLLSAWHEHTFYIVQHAGEDCPIRTGRGVRQGCKAAPGLWNCYMIDFLDTLTEVIPITWIRQHITLYADDIHIGVTFTSLEELCQLQQYLGLIFHTLHRMKLQINPNKSVAIFELRGSQGRRLRQRFVRADSTGESFKIEVPGEGLQYIPIHKSTKYLGIVISYHQFEDDSLKHRLTLMKVAFHRLRRWLVGKHGLSMQQRYTLWRTCVYPVFSYGIFAQGMTPKGIQLAVVQLTVMLRRIMHDHSYITRRSHDLAFAVHKIPHPTRLLHGTATSLLTTVCTRATQLLPHDLAHTITWTHLPELLQTLDAMQATTSLETPLHSTLEACATVAFYQCTQCDFCTDNVSAFRRHCTIEHCCTMHRTRFVDIMHFSDNGLPICKQCHQHFTTWRMFQSHLERGCQVAVIGPDACTGVNSLSLAPRHTLAMQPVTADVAMRGFRLISQNELQNLRAQDFGDRLLHVVSERLWERVAGDQVACRYLSRRCFICSYQFSRCQELHQHFRLQHTDLWEFVPQKAIQLTNLYCTDSPCECCGSPFRTHMCPIWTQLAVMLVTGAGREAIEPNGPPEVHCRCEICLEVFSSTGLLVQHLQAEHALQGLSFNPGRDALGQDSACSHCGQIFDTMSGLKSHIVQGRCAFFNPQATAETQPVDELWSSACLEGQFLAVLKPPANRLRLTVTCQACGKGCKRAADLALHLQTAHARLWRKSQRLTLILVAAYYQNQCFCNPTLGVKRANHICLPLRQLAMAFHRLDREPFAPMFITDQLLHSVLSHNMPQLDKHRLEVLLAQLQFTDLWQDLEVLSTLSCCCIFCGKRLATADLAMHLHEEHHSKHDMVCFYMEQFIPVVHALNEEDFRCQLCRLIYNLPANLRPDETLAERQALAQSHLRSSCPVLLQLSILFASLLNGNGLHHGLCGSGHARTDDGHVRGPGSTSDTTGPLLETGSQSSVRKVSETRRTAPPTKVRRRSEYGRTQGAPYAPASENADTTGGQTRPGTSKPTKDGSIHSFFEPRASGCASYPLAGDRDLEGPDGTGQSQPTTGPSATSDDRLAEEHANPSWTDRGGQRDGPAAPDVGDQRGDLGGQELPLSQVGSAGAEVGHRQEACAQLHQDAPESHRAVGDDAGQGVDHQVSRPTSTHRSAEGHSVAAPAQSSLGQTVRVAPLLDSQLSVDDGWSINEAAYIDTDSHGNHSAINAGQLEEPEQGQGTWQAQQAGQMTATMLANLTKGLCGLQLHNDANWCYGNSTISCLLWTLVSLQTSATNLWGLHSDELVHFIQQHSNGIVKLADLPWFRQILNNWGSSQGQQDSAEFTHQVLTWLSAPASDMRWERRLAATDGVHVLDVSSTCIPITLQFTSTNAAAWTLQSLRNDSCLASGAVNANGAADCAGLSVPPA